jgi:aminopeptidase N
MGSLGDPDVVDQARERFAAFVREPATLDAATRRIVLDVVARNADAATWDALHRLARDAPTMLERQEYYSLLAAARDPAQSARALALVLSGEPPATFASGMLSAAAKYHAGAVLDWLGAHWDRMGDVLGAVNPGPSTATLMENASDPSLVPRLEAFAKRHVPEGGRRSLLVAEANIRYRAQVREQRLPELARWVAAGQGLRYSAR